MKNKKLLLSLLAVLFLCPISQNVFAQTGNLAKLYQITVKPGHQAEFVAALKEHTEWRKQEGDPWNWTVYQVVNGQNLGDFLIRSGNHSWAELDGYEDFLAKGSVPFNKNVGPHIESITNSITSVDTTCVNWPENNDEVKLLSVLVFHLKPGHEWTFSQLTRKFDKAVKANNREGHYVFIWPENGLPGPRVTLVMPYKNWAEMAGPKESLGDFIYRVMGADEAQKFWDGINDAIRSTESFVLKVRPDLSVLHDNQN